MNANELADINEWSCCAHSKEVSAMLRQQQAEIEALKLQLHTTLTNRDLRTYDGKTEMNNEPVAWISVLGIDLIGQKFTDVRVSLTKTDVASIPLYTHPVKEQDESFDRTASHMAVEYVAYKAELTDEEIIKVYEDMLGVASAKGSAIDFARAILRKAGKK
jgi:hypothetical protein